MISLDINRKALTKEQHANFIGYLLSLVTSEIERARANNGVTQQLQVDCLMTDDEVGEFIRAMEDLGHFAMEEGFDGDNDAEYKSYGIEVCWDATAENRREFFEQIEAQKKVMKETSKKRGDLLVRAIKVSWCVGFVGGVAVTVVCGLIARSFGLF